VTSSRPTGGATVTSFVGPAWPATCNAIAAPKENPASHSASRARRGILGAALERPGRAVDHHGLRHGRP
jgi:hypothetical protein